MARYVLIDDQGLPRAIFSMALLVVASVVLYVNLKYLDLYPPHDKRTAFKQCVIVAVITAIWVILRLWKVSRRVIVDRDGLEIDEGYFLGLYWTKQFVLRATISAVEEYEVYGKNMMLFGFRARLVDGSAISLTLSHLEQKVENELIEVKKALEIE